MAALDVEDQGILSTIFKESFPDSWRDNPEFAQYLAELSSYGVDKLGREPDRLAEERASILEQTQDLAFHNYKTFIQTAECSREIFQDFQIIERHVGSMLEKLPPLTEECTHFIAKAQEINMSRRMNNMTLQRHTHILEVLEIPQLMDTCVRNGYYEEALDLAAHVKRLEKKHSSISVIANIVNEVRHSTTLMLNQLIQQLRTNVQLPACLRVIGYLRRMDVFTESELRIKFLQARDSWFQGILNGIPADDPYYHITKVIEASRVHLFDIITQYRAIFSDEDPLLSPHDDLPNEGALFHGWVIEKVSQFLHTLEMDLERGMNGRLDSVLGQCMYFGLSFSRVGADFRGLLAPLFQKAALSSFSSSITEANQRFDEVMQSYTLLGTPSMLASSTYTLATQGSGQLQPSVILLEYPPLASYCNDLLTAFNELRLCAPLSLACSVAQKLQQSLEGAVDIILAYYRAEETTFNQQERGRFTEYCQAFCDHLVPHLNKCLQTMFPPSKISQALGLSVIDLVRMGNVGLIEVNTVIQPLEHLLPAKAEEPAAPASQSTEDEVESSTENSAADAESSVEQPSDVPPAAGTDSSDVPPAASADSSDVPPASIPEPEQSATTETSDKLEETLETDKDMSDEQSETNVQTVDNGTTSVTEESGTSQPAVLEEVDLS